MKNSYLQKEIGWLLKEKFNGILSKEARKDIEKMKKGEPFDYLIGFVDFLGCKIDLSQKPFIPEPETEFWVEKALEQLKIENPSAVSSGPNCSGPNCCKLKIIRILDIFSGSGCIGLAVLKNIENAKVVFAEVEKKLLKQIKINAELNKIDKKRYKIIHSDIFQNIRGKFDYIFANPPYIAESRKNKVQKSVLDFEPKIALFGGKDGLRHIGIFLSRAKDFLKKDGKIYMEFDSWQRNKIEKLLRQLGYNHYEFRKDQYGKWRYLIIKSVF